MMFSDVLLTFTNLDRLREIKLGRIGLNHVFNCSGMILIMKLLSLIGLNFFIFLGLLNLGISTMRECEHY